MNIKEIAKEAGVSVSTVSKALNNKEDISKKLKEKIKEIAKKRGYKPNPLAKRLASKKTNTIGVFILHTKNLSFYESFAMELLGKITKLATKDEVDVTLFTPEKEIDYLKIARERKLDGIILIGLTLEDKNIEKLKGSKIPVSILDQSLQGENIRKVFSDNSSGIEKGVNYLVEKGHKKITFIGGKAHSEVARIRREAFVNSMKKHRLLSESKIYRTNFFYEEGEKIANKVVKLKNRPTAIFCATDILAFGLIKGLKREGIRVPEEISVMGFDNISAGKLIEPELTTISQNIEKLGEKLYRNLYERDEDLVEISLVERESVIDRS